MKRLSLHCLPIIAWYSTVITAIKPFLIGLSIWLERWQEHNNR